MSDFRTIILGVVICINFALAFLILSKGKKRKESNGFGLFVVALGVWALGLFMFYRATDPGASLFWAKTLYFTGNIIATCFLYFSFVFPEQNKRMPIWKKMVIFSPLFFLFYSYYFTDIIIVGTLIEGGSKSFLYGPFRWAFDIPFMVYFTWAFIKLFIKYRKAVDRIRFQLRYIVFGVLFALIMAAVTNIILLWFQIFKYIWLGPEATLIIVGATTYAIIRYQLMDIKIVLKRGALYSVIALYVYAWFYGATWFLNHFFGNIYARNALISAGFIAIIFVATFVYFEKLIKYLINKYFFGNLYEQHELLRKLARKITTVVGLKNLTDLILKTAMQNMQCNKSAIILKKNEHYEAIHQVNVDIKPFKDNPATKFLEHHQKGITYEEFEMRDLGHLQKYFKDWDIDLFLPVINRQKLYGIICLGAKLNRDAYTKNDIDLLQDVANQAGVALENALIYNKIEQKVEEQTQAIKKLLNAKNEFLNIASHQLRGPVSAIRGMLSMIVEGGMKPEEERDFIQKTYESVNRLAVIINDILDAQAFSGSSPKEIKLNLKPTNIQKLIKDIIKMFQNKAEKKKLYLRFEKHEQAIPKVIIDVDRIRGAIENLIDNALKYTKKGGVTISIKMLADSLEIRIQDTGIGLTKDDKKILFKKFSRGRGGKEVDVNSSGLGLYIAKNIALAHGGDLFAESKGKNKGSCFVLSLSVR